MVDVFFGGGGGRWLREGVSWAHFFGRGSSVSKVGLS